MTEEKAVIPNMQPRLVLPIQFQVGFPDELAEGIFMAIKAERCGLAGILLTVETNHNAVVILLLFRFLPGLGRWHEGIAAFARSQVEVMEKIIIPAPSRCADIGILLSFPERKGIQDKPGREVTGNRPAAKMIMGQGTLQQILGGYIVPAVVYTEQRKMFLDKTSCEVAGQGPRQN